MNLASFSNFYRIDLYLIDICIPMHKFTDAGMIKN